MAGTASNGARGKWELLRSTPADTSDPYVISARRRLARWEEVSAARLGIGERPFLIQREEYLRIRSEFEGPDVTLLEIDASNVTTEEDFLILLGKVYGFPEYYGENWDAFLDCYADVVEADDSPVVMALCGLSNFCESNFRTFIRSVYELESITESISLFRSVIPRKVINLYPGDWSAFSGLADSDPG
ncbi:barstar family protein [Streptomyces beijiangensis]|uniref:Barstar family protein n=1 Tax=Streptomyces beijiangensis TaxID=163361 RepID=A0A939F9Z5_9ACTN|nr:barstar family protein [Streptomyces beijiangensis]MBO0514777.1 barstar family protein [Streptomyces beijiangensis]